MDIEKIISPDISGRKVIPGFLLKGGDIVAFATRYQERLRTGLMILSEENPQWLTWSVNLYKEDGREWDDDSVPTDEIIFFESTKAEKAYALSKALSYWREVMTANLLNESYDEAKKAYDIILGRIVNLTE